MRKYTEPERKAEIIDGSAKQENIDPAVLPEVVYNHAGVDLKTLSAGGFTLTMYYYEGIRIPKETAQWCISRYNQTGRRAARLEVYYHMHPEKLRALALAL